MCFSICYNVAPKPRRSGVTKSVFGRLLFGHLLVALLLGLPTAPVRGEAMLELFHVRWVDLTAKMPELAEAA